MNAAGVLDGGFVTAAEPVMEQKLSLNVTLFTPSYVCERMAIMVACHYAEEVSRASLRWFYSI